MDTNLIEKKNQIIKSEKTAVFNDLCPFLQTMN